MTQKVKQSSINSTKTGKISRADKGMGVRSNRKRIIVDQYTLTQLMVRLLEKIGDGIERGELFQVLYGLERRYRGYYTDPCFSQWKKSRYEKLYKKAQPILTSTLKRLEGKELVTLHRHRKFVKRVQLTPAGEKVVQQLTIKVDHSDSGSRAASKTPRSSRLGLEKNLEGIG